MIQLSIHWLIIPAWRLLSQPMLRILRRRKNVKFHPSRNNRSFIKPRTDCSGNRKIRKYSMKQTGAIISSIERGWFIAAIYCPLPGQPGSACHVLRLNWDGIRASEVSDGPSPRLKSTLKFRCKLSWARQEYNLHYRQPLTPDLQHVFELLKSQILGSIWRQDPSLRFLPKLNLCRYHIQLRFEID